jgi:hypothetical protein
VTTEIWAPKLLPEQDESKKSNQRGSTDGGNGIHPKKPKQKNLEAIEVLTGTRTGNSTPERKYGGRQPGRAGPAMKNGAGSHGTLDRESKQKAERRNKIRKNPILGARTKIRAEKQRSDPAPGCTVTPK